MEIRSQRYASDDVEALYASAVSARRYGERSVWGRSIRFLISLEEWDTLSDALQGSPVDWVRPYYPVTGCSSESWKLAARCLKVLKGPDEGLEGT